MASISGRVLRQSLQFSSISGFSTIASESIRPMATERQRHTIMSTESARIYSQGDKRLLSHYGCNPQDAGKVCKTKQF